MTVKIYLLIEAQVGETKQVVGAIRKLPEVESVDAVTGPYDIIAIVQVKGLNDIGEVVVKKVHPISGISRVVTCVALHK